MIATRDFNERYQNMKLYKKGDPYSSDDKNRVAFLVENGYLKEPEAKEVVETEDSTPKDKPSSKKADKKKSGD